MSNATTIDRLDAVEAGLEKLWTVHRLQNRLLFTLASVLRRQLSSGCAEQRAITEQMHELRGGIKEHLRAEAALARELKEMREKPEGPPNEQVSRGGKVRDKEAT